MMYLLSKYSLKECLLPLPLPSPWQFQQHASLLQKKKKKCSELSVKNSSVTSECLSTVAAPITNAQLDWVGIALQREESWAEKTMDDTTGGFWREEAYSIFHIVK